MGTLKWILATVVAALAGLFVVWALAHIALAAIIVAMFIHIIHFGFRGFEVYAIAIGAVFIVIATLKCIFNPRW